MGTKSRPSCPECSLLSRLSRLFLSCFLPTQPHLTEPHHQEHHHVRGVMKKAAQRAGKWAAAMGTKSRPSCPECSLLSRLFLSCFFPTQPHLTEPHHQEHHHVRGVIKKAAQRAGKWAAAMGTKSCPPCPDCSLQQQQQQQLLQQLQQKGGKYVGQQQQEEEEGLAEIDLRFPSVSSDSSGSALRVVGPLCTASGFVDCGCPYGESGRVEFSGGLPGQERQEGEEGEGEKKPLCVDGSSPGRWTGFDQWEADNCQY
ncbi:unnamed protein product, partial [Closterium sp. NIES-54]